MAKQEDEKTMTSKRPPQTKVKRKKRLAELLDEAIRETIVQRWAVSRLYVIAQKVVDDEDSPFWRGLRIASDRLNSLNRDNARLRADVVALKREVSDMADLRDVADLRKELDEKEVSRYEAILLLQNQNSKAIDDNVTTSLRLMLDRIVSSDAANTKLEDDVVTLKRGVSNLADEIESLRAFVYNHQPVIKTIIPAREQ